MASQTTEQCSVPVYTQCLLQNLAGSNFYLKLDGPKSWHGHGDPPETIQDQKNGNFRHYSDDEGSIAGVAYILVMKQDNGTDTLKWVTAWSNPKGSNNKVYTEILEANAAVDWNNVRTKLEGSDNKSNYTKDGYSATAKIDGETGTPQLIAELKKA